MAARQVRYNCTPADAALLRRVRVAMAMRDGMSWKQLAFECGVSTDVFARWRRDRRWFLKVETVERVERWLSRQENPLDRCG